MENSSSTVCRLEPAACTYSRSPTSHIAGYLCITSVIPSQSLNGTSRTNERHRTLPLSVWSALCRHYAANRFFSAQVCFPPQLSRALRFSFECQPSPLFPPTFDLWERTLKQLVPRASILNAGSNILVENMWKKRQKLPPWISLMVSEKNKSTLNKYGTREKNKCGNQFRIYKGR